MTPVVVVLTAIAAASLGALGGFIVGIRVTTGTVDADADAAADQGPSLAEQLAPITSSLARFERQVSALDRRTIEQRAQLESSLSMVAQTNAELRRSTDSVASALHATTERGSWGELQLRRVIEHTGLLPRVDFDEQVHLTDDHGRAIRPDAVVHLPGGKHLVIDAKAPRDGATLRAHVASLAHKQYWDAVAGSPEVVLCFVPTDALLAEALATDPDLLDDALARKVTLVSPSSLFVALQAVATSWQHATLADSARDLHDVGRQVYRGLVKLSEHADKLGRSLKSSVDTYNQFVGSLERNALVQARRMTDLGVAADTDLTVRVIEDHPRHLSAPELVEHRERSA